LSSTPNIPQGQQPLFLARRDSAQSSTSAHQIKKALSKISLESKFRMNIINGTGTLS